MNTKEDTILFILISVLAILSIFIILLGFKEDIKNIKNEEYYKIGYCEALGGEFIQNTCIDKNYILELKN